MHVLYICWELPRMQSGFQALSYFASDITLRLCISYHIQLTSYMWYGWFQRSIEWPRNFQFLKLCLIVIVKEVTFQSVYSSLNYKVSSLIYRNASTEIWWRAVMLGSWQLIAVEWLQMLLRARGPLTGNSITFLIRVVMCKYFVE